jgi:DNA-binding transcriptional ArsR family regulator
MPDRDDADGSAAVAAICKALSHPLRVEFIEALQRDDGTLSASKFANAKDADLSRVAYHAVRLKEAGVLEVASERKVRGATERSYSLTGTNAELAVKLIAMARNGCG